MAPPRRVPNSARRTREHLTPAEVERLIAAAGNAGRHGHRDATLQLLTYRHALRVGSVAIVEQVLGGSLLREALDDLLGGPGSGSGGDVLAVGVGTAVPCGREYR